MFEHSIYEPEPVAEPLNEGDLFYHYELPNWKPGSRLYKILGISAAANLLAFLVFTATPILTMKGCDSPLVGNVCQVLDTLYVGSTLLGTDRNYVDAVYDKTKIGDADITFVDVSGDTPPLDYPEGYFQIANPLEYQSQLDALNNPAGVAGTPTAGIPPGIALTTPDQGSALFNTRPRLPKPNPNAVTGDLPTGFGSSGTVATNGGRHGGRNGNKNSVDDAAPTPSPSPAPTVPTTDAINAVQINKLPLTEFADLVSQRWAAKQVDLSQDFTVVLDGVITQDGRLDKTKSKYDPVKTVGDPKMVEIGKVALEALGESGYLTYLKMAGVDQIHAVLTQDDQNVTVKIMSVQKSPERANVVSSIVSAAILGGKIKVQNPSDERTLLDGAQSTTDGKSFILNFAIPKPVAQEMITRKLQEAQAKKAQPQPSSDSLMKPNNNTALRQ